MRRSRTVSLVMTILAACSAAVEAKPLKLHAIFTSHMVIQRDKPVVIWGWGDAGEKVSVKFGDEQAQATAAGDAGRWEVTFPARGASAKPTTLVVTAGSEKVELDDILVGDVWVMEGQSNMALPLNKITEADLEIPQANLPLLRDFSIKTNEQATLKTDIAAEAVENGGWEVSTPQTAGGISAIGYVFGSRLQRALGIPIGLICNARGGASIESMVPRQMFDQDPLAKRYAESVEKRMAEFDPRAAALETWQRQLTRARDKGLPEAKWPKKPAGAENLSSWNTPGRSPSDMASVYNGMFGVFKGFNIKGVVFHQGYNNAMTQVCRPRRYRVLMKLMVEGWRQDFGPNLPVGVIGFCAGGETQNEENFEAVSDAGGPFIRESQRLGLADVGDAKNTAFIPAYDVQVPGLHPKKKRELGLRAARWALAEVYGLKVVWQTASLVSAEPHGDEMILTFDSSVVPDDRNSIPCGFSIAGEDGKFYMAHARYQVAGVDKRPKADTRIIHVWSPLVKRPVAVRYGWATSPMGNLKVNAHPDCPLPSFRTDHWDWPESDDPDVAPINRAREREIAREAAERCDYRRSEEAKSGVEIFERLKTLGMQPETKGSKGEKSVSGVQ